MASLIFAAFPRPSPAATVQFDLESLLPRGRRGRRIQQRPQDQSGQKDPKSEQPWFLLAYLDYNTDRRMGKRDLKEAELRAGGASDRRHRHHSPILGAPVQALAGATVNAKDDSAVRAQSYRHPSRPAPGIEQVVACGPVPESEAQNPSHRGGSLNPPSSEGLPQSVLTTIDGPGSFRFTVLVSAARGGRGFENSQSATNGHGVFARAREMVMALQKYVTEFIGTFFLVGTIGFLTTTNWREKERTVLALEWMWLDGDGFHGRPRFRRAPANPMVFMANPGGRENVGDGLHPLHHLAARRRDRCGDGGLRTSRRGPDSRGQGRSTHIFGVHP